MLADLLAVVRDAMGPSYPEIVTDFARIAAVAALEEEAFLATLATGSRLFENAVASTRSGGGTVLSGENAFALHDTYGFPIDLTLEMAAEAGLEVDEGAFRSLMDQQRARAKADAAGRKQGGADHTVLPHPARGPPAGRVPRLHRPAGRRRASSGCSSTACPCRSPARATPSRWCWTTRPSTPSPAASSPTPA